MTSLSDQTRGGPSRRGACAISEPWTTGTLVRFASRVQEGDQLLEIFGRHVTELANVAGAYGLFEIAQKSQTGRRDSDPYHAAVVGRALTLDETALLERIEHPGNVWRP